MGTTNYYEPPLAKVYVQVKVFFDSVGFMKPVEVIWSNGRTYRIDQVIDRHESQVAYSRQVHRQDLRAGVQPLL